MADNILKKLCYFVSSIAIFMMICSVIAGLTTIIWLVCPISSEYVMKIARWIIGVLITMGLIVSHKIKINEDTEN